MEQFRGWHSLSGIAKLFLFVSKTDFSGKYSIDSELTTWFHPKQIFLLTILFNMSQAFLGVTDSG